MRPPLAPSRFAAQLARYRFTNNADLKVVCDLYDQTLRDGFGARERLAYGDCGWGDADLEELGMTLSEVAAPEVVALDLSSNKELRSLAAVGAAVRGPGALASLQILDLRECRMLTSLPAELGRLTSLRTLYLSECDALTGMPDLSALPQLDVKYLPNHLKAWEEGGRKMFDFMTDDPADATEIKMLYGITALPGWLCRHSALQTLNLNWCKALKSLPAELANLTSLRTLNLFCCDALTGMPDLSGLPQLKVESLPDHLKAWEAGGRKAGTFERR